MEPSHPKPAPRLPLRTLCAPGSNALDLKSGVWVGKGCDPSSRPPRDPPTTLHTRFLMKIHIKALEIQASTAPCLVFPPLLQQEGLLLLFVGAAPPKIVFPRFDNCSRHFKINRAARAKDRRSKSDVSHCVIQCCSQELVAFSTAKKSQGLS